MHKGDVIVILSVVLAGTIGCSSVPNGKASSQDYTATSERTKETILEGLGTVLKSSGEAARIYFSGSCEQDDAGNLVFPAVNIHAPTTSESGLDAVRAMFRDDANVHVSEDISGIAKITIGNVSGKILETNIPLLRLDQRAQYNPGGLEGVIPAIESTTEFMTASRELNVQQASVFYIGGVRPALETLPHLPATVSNVTAEQVLDMVATTFKGAVLYGECAKADGEKLIDIEFYYLGGD